MMATCEDNTWPVPEIIADKLMKGAGTDHGWEYVDKLNTTVRMGDHRIHYILYPLREIAIRMWGIF